MQCVIETTLASIRWSESRSASAQWLSDSGARIFNEPAQVLQDFGCERLALPQAIQFLRLSDGCLKNCHVCPFAYNRALSGSHVTSTLLSVASSCQSPMAATVAFGHHDQNAPVPPRRNFDDLFSRSLFSLDIFLQ